MKKLIVILASIALVMCFGSVVFAAESDAVISTAGAITEAIETPVTEAKTPITEDVSSTEDTPESAAEWLVNGFVDNLDKILAGIGGIISMIVLVLQKSTIIPQQNAFVNNTSKTFTSFANDIATFRVDMKNNIDGISGTVAESIDRLNAVIAVVEELQRQQKESAEDRKLLANALAKESDMLNEIIKASSMMTSRKVKCDEMHDEVIAAANTLANTKDGEVA